MLLIQTYLAATGLVAVLGLAVCSFSPRLLCWDSTRPLILIFGIAALAILVRLSYAFDFSNSIISPIIALLALVGAFRLYLIRSQIHTQTIAEEFKDLLIIGLLLLPTAIKLGASSFDGNDEIYSWNYWAKLIFLKEPLDYYFTQAPYPVLFSSLIAGVYSIFGSLEYQSVAKAVLWYIPFSVVLMIARLYPKERRWQFYSLLVVLLFFLDLEKEFAKGLADPFMAGLLFAGFYSLLNPKVCHLGVNTSVLLATFFVAAASISKQAALPWALVIYPMFLILWLRHKQKPIKIGFVALLPIAISMLWIFTIGNDFHQNKGVIQASMADRSLFQQLLYASLQFIREEPLPFLFVVFAFLVVLRKRIFHLQVVLLGCTLSMVLWLLFGSYDIRLGMHVFLLLWLAFIVASNDSELLNLTIPFKIRIGLLFCTVFLVVVYSHKKYSELSSDYLYQERVLGYNMGSKQQIVKLFGSQAMEFIEQINASRATVWTGSNYIYGALYGHGATVLKPKFDSPNVIEDLKRLDVDYILLTRDGLLFGEAGRILQKTILEHPVCFEKTLDTPNSDVGLSVFRYYKNCK